MRISIDEYKKRTARMRAKKDCFVKACSSNFYENKDEDLNMNLDNDGTWDESTLVRRRPNDSEFLDLDAKLIKVGLKRLKL